MKVRRLMLASTLAAILAAGAAVPAADAPATAPDSSAAPDSIVAADSTGAAPADTALAFRFEDAGDVIGGTTDASRLVQPAGVAVDDFGRFYVTDAALHRLLRFDPGGAFLGGSGGLGSEPGRLRRPGSVGLLGTLDVAVLDRENRRVVTYDIYGRLESVLINLRADDLERQVGRVDPVSLACDRGGAVYVADVDRDRVLVFDYSGALVREIGGYGAHAGSFRGLRGVAAGRRGEIVTTERGGARVQRIDPAGRVVASWPLPVRDGREGLPAAVDAAGRVAVADEREGRLWLFTPDGGLLAETMGLAAPSALAFDRGGALVVAEGGAGRLRRFAVVGTAGGAPEHHEP